MYGLSNRPLAKDWTLEEARDYCHDLTVSHYENFPVGSLLVPKTKRPHVYAIYSFARVSDDFADEVAYEGRRLDHLNGWEERLEDCYRGKADHPVFIALADTVKQCDLSIELFRGLLHAFKKDVTVKRYDTLDSVIEYYCQYSANPVGRLILSLFDYRDDERFELSDHICTALQLTNFWQDIAIDLKKDRIYIPREEMKREGYCEEELFAHVYDSRFQTIMSRLAQQTWALFDRGFPLVEKVQWPLNAELRFTWLGGTTILARLAKNRYDAFGNRPKLSKWDLIAMGGRSLGRIGRKRQRLKTLFDEQHPAA